MNDELVNSVVNNLADKIGIAAEKLAPIAETMVAETATKYAVLAATSGSILLLACGILYGIAWSLWKKGREHLEESQKLDDVIGWFVGGGILAALTTLILLLVGNGVINDIGRAVAPTVTLVQQMK